MPDKKERLALLALSLPGLRIFTHWRTREEYSRLAVYKKDALPLQKLALISVYHFISQAISLLFLEINFLLAPRFPLFARIRPAELQSHYTTPATFATCFQIYSIETTLIYFTNFAPMSSARLTSHLIHITHSQSDPSPQRQMTKDKRYVSFLTGSSTTWRAFSKNM